MKNLFFVFLLSFLCVFVYGQQKENTFQESENAATGTTSAELGNEKNNSSNPQGKVGNPPGDVPIDSALPILFIAGLGIIIYYNRYKLIRN